MSELSTISRRGFLVGIGAAGAAAWLPHRLAAAPGDIKFGYAAITWDGNDVQAIADVSSVGFKGIQLRSPIVKEYGDRPAALRELLARQRLTMVALSSGNARIDIPVGYHHHMNSLGERPEEVDAILDAADSRYVRLVLDVAHYQMGGGDPVTAVRRYADRLLFLHIKALETPVPGATGDLSRSDRFVERGRGKVNLPAVFAAVDDVRFRGRSSSWTVSRTMRGRPKRALS